MKNCVTLMLLYCISCLCFGQQARPLGGGYEFDGNGKAPNATALSQLYTATQNAEGWRQALAGDNTQLMEALKNQYRYLFLKDPDQTHRLESLLVENRRLKLTVTTLLQLLRDSLPDPGAFELFQISGEDGRGHVHYTAYFTPVLNVATAPDEHYRYPLYKRPETWQGPLPTREEIDGKGKLSNRALEIAWSPSLLDNFFMHVQGSGYVKFPDGSLQLLANKGANGHPYSSIGKYLVAGGHVPQESISLESITNWFRQNPDSLERVLFKNKSYTFFTPTNDKPYGASGLPLTPGHSIAVDPTFIPFGAVLLAEVPVLNEQGVLQKHEYRILTAQDRGGAIKGPGHVDLYAGVGDEALKKASAMHHYGNLWLILVR